MRFYVCVLFVSCLFPKTSTMCMVTILPCQLTGQPVLIGGTMGTCSYVLTGTDKGMTETFGTTCHGAVSVTCARCLCGEGR